MRRSAVTGVPLAPVRGVARSVGGCGRGARGALNFPAAALPGNPVPALPRRRADRAPAAGRRGARPRWLPTSLRSQPATLHSRRPEGRHLAATEMATCGAGSARRLASCTGCSNQGIRRWYGARSRAEPRRTRAAPQQAAACTSARPASTASLQPARLQLPQLLHAPQRQSLLRERRGPLAARQPPAEGLAGSGAQRTRQRTAETSGTPGPPCSCPVRPGTPKPAAPTPARRRRRQPAPAHDGLHRASRLAACWAACRVG